jgi:outer membrane protein OmpA-like peptidoglycan-associated protein
MKKVFLLLVSALWSLGLLAQDTAGGKKVKPYVDYSDSIKRKFCIDVNLLGGVLSESLGGSSLSSFYPNTVAANTKVDNPSFSAGTTVGADLGFGLFLGKKRHWGIGAGFMYLSQSGTITLNNFQIGYKSLDDSGNVFRQLITSTGAITEKVTITNMNIPVVIKYRKNFGGKWGFTADAGVLYNLSLENKWSGNASFNYEAIYSKVNGVIVYDGADQPSASDLLITKSAYLSSHDNNPTNMADYFNYQAAHGKNVGLNVAGKTTSGTVTYTEGKVGFIFRPMLNYEISDKLSINAGGFLLYQPFTNSVASNYTLTDKVGSYNSILNGVSNNTYMSVGLNLGLRLYFGKSPDRDDDGVEDKYDLCPDEFGIIKLNGCPDFDKDGIPDKDDSCPKQWGLAKFGGCPDKDKDGIPDRRDSCPRVAGLAEFNGCPDTDKDGIPDREDSCPTVKGPIENHGCPVVKKEEPKADLTFTVVDTADKKTGTKSSEKEPAAEKEIVKGDDKNKKEKGNNKKDKKVADVDKDKKKHQKDVPKGPVVKEPKHVEKEIVDKTDDKLKKVGEPVLFDLGKSTIKESCKASIAEAAKKLKESSTATIVIEGHTDTTGPVSYNNSLSLRRAIVLKEYLVSLGVDPKKIKTVGMGSKKPAADNHTRAGRLRNRRAEMNFKD